MKLKPITLSLIISLLIHLIFLSGDKSILQSDSEKISLHKFKINQLRLLGSKDSKKKNLMAVPSKISVPQKIAPSLKNLSFDSLPMNKYVKKIIKKKKETRDFTVKNFLKNPIRDTHTSQEVLGGLNSSELNIKFELPEGVPEDELNQRELVFYSFQKRTVESYINSFVKELNEFKRKNPRTDFPLTKKKQTLAGKITYDKNGDILSIKTLAWSDIDKLQNFFMDVLKNIESIPNPPIDILENDQFAINFILTIND